MENSIHRGKYHEQCWPSPSQVEFEILYAQLGELEFELHCNVDSTRTPKLRHVIFILAYIMSIKVLNYIAGLL
jgi:hypothetical protein